jgi:hypothetical protein
MSTTRSPIELAPGERIAAYRDRQAGVSWPLPVDVKLDQLLQQARDVGERTSRREIVAAVVGLCDLDGDGLSTLLRRFRLATVSDVLDHSGNENVLAFRAHGPGPRRGA